MGLVDYSDSDSDGSDNGTRPTPKSTAINNKPAFQKLTDSSTGKICVSLPAAKDNSDEQPAERTKIGAGSLSGFNSFLQPPKKTGAAGLPLPAPKAENGDVSARTISATKRAFFN